MVYLSHNRVLIFRKRISNKNVWSRSKKYKESENFKKRHIWQTRWLRSLSYKLYHTLRSLGVFFGVDFDRFHVNCPYGLNFNYLTCLLLGIKCLRLTRHIFKYLSNPLYQVEYFILHAWAIYYINLVEHSSNL